MITVRPRVDADLDACVEVLKRVKAVDGYPVFWPEGPRRFVAPPYELAAWVAVDGDGVAGHVALHRGEQDPGFDLVAVEVGPDAPTASVGRLFVDPDRQRSGLGARLLVVAADEARARGMHPFLNVVESQHKAISMYRAQRWAELGRVVFDLGRDRSVALLVFSAPPG